MRILYLEPVFPARGGRHPDAGLRNGALSGVGRTPGDDADRGPQPSVRHHPARVQGQALRAGLPWTGSTSSACGSRPRPEKTFATRMVFYLTYMINATLAGLLLARGRYDVVYATSPPLFVGGAALALSYLRRIPLVFEVRDLWPESAVALGEMTNSRAVALAGKLEEMCYNRARCVVVVTEGIRRRLEERGFGRKAGAHPQRGQHGAVPSGSGGGQRRCGRNWGWRSKFLVIYAGIHGVAQGLETVLEAARAAAGRCPIFISSLWVRAPKRRSAGPAGRAGTDQRHDVGRAASGRRCRPICLRLMWPWCLCGDWSSSEGALPSKMFDAWACGCPVLLSIDGEARQVLEQADAGVFVEPEDAEQMAQAILQLKGDPDRLRQFGKNGRRFVEAHYSRAAVGGPTGGIAASGRHG